MDLPSWPEVFAADYVIKSIIISVWAPLLLRLIFFFLCSWVERRGGSGVHGNKQVFMCLYRLPPSVITAQFKGPNGDCECLNLNFELPKPS